MVLQIVALNMLKLRSIATFILDSALVLNPPA